MTAERTPIATLRPLHDSAAAVADFMEGSTVLVFAHQDDDLLWMLPFFPIADHFLLSAYPSSQLFEDIVNNYPAHLKYRQRWQSIWGSVDKDIWAGLFTDACARESIVNVDTIKGHLRNHLGPEVRRVITHNNWGEYGHYEHRLINQAVRELAVETGFDVWGLALRIDWFPEPEGWRVEYVNVADTLKLPSIEGYFDGDLFREIRQVYLEAIPLASTAALSQRLLSFSPTAWTWLTRPDDYPTGWRPYIKLVDRGLDLTLEHPGIAHLDHSIGVTQGCKRSQTLPNRVLLGLLKRNLQQAWNRQRQKLVGIQPDH